MNKLNFFKKNGYYVANDVIFESTRREFYFTLYDLVVSRLGKVGFSKKPCNWRNVKEVDYPNNLNLLDSALLDLFRYDSRLVGEVYDTISASPTFLRLVCSSEIENIARELLGLSPRNSLYSWMLRVLIQPPRDHSRTYGWHQDIFYSIPESRFVQLWCPLLRDATVENGTLEICLQSHSKGIVRQTWSDPEDRNFQIIVDQKIVDEFQRKKIELKAGDVLFFDPHLIHRSGENNSKDQIRFTCVGKFFDTGYEGHESPFPRFEYRSISPKDYFARLKGHTD